MSTPLLEEFSTQIDRLQRCGKGLVMISHIDEEDVETDGGKTIKKITTSLSGQAAKVIIPLADLMLYAEYVRDSRGESQRALFTRGSDLVDGGCRRIAGRNLPPVLPLTEEGGYEILAAAMRGEEIDMGGILPSSAANPTLKSYTIKSREEASKMATGATPPPARRKKKKKVRR